MKNLLCFICISLFLVSCDHKVKSEKEIDTKIENQQDADLREVLHVTKHELIKVFQPQPNTEISSPLKIEGEARGNWFFEASAPVELVNEKMEVMATSYIEPIAPWMTEDFVPFKGELSYEVDHEFSGFLIFHKSNPSDLRKHDDSYKIPIIFKHN